MSGPLIEWRGPADAPPLLLLHGFMGVPEDWAEFAARLEGRRLGYVRLRAMPPGRLAARLREECGRPAALAGYSMGGRLAIWLAVRDPVSFPCLAALSATAGIEGEAERQARREADEALARRLCGLESDTEFLGFLEKEWRVQGVFRPAAAPEPGKLREKLAARAALCRADLAAQLRLWGQGALPSSWHLLPRYPGRALLLAGGCDLKYRSLAARMAALCRRAEARVLPGAGHDLLLDAPAEAGAAAREFFREAGW